jgi:hypothetical protein
LTILKANSCSIGRKIGEIWTSKTLLQPISFKADRLPAHPCLDPRFSRHGISLSTRRPVPRIIGTRRRKNTRACQAATIVFSFIRLHMSPGKANLEFSGSQPVQPADTGSPISATKSREYLYITNQPDRSRCDETSKRRVKLFPCTIPPRYFRSRNSRHFFTPHADRDVRNRTDIVLFITAILLQ